MSFLHAIIINKNFGPLILQLRDTYFFDLVSMYLSMQNLPDAMVEYKLLFLQIFRSRIHLYIPDDSFAAYLYNIRMDIVNGYCKPISMKFSKDRVKDL